ncbi:Copper-transporting P-type ATPase [compost metagenome]
MRTHILVAAALFLAAPSAALAASGHDHHQHKAHGTGHTVEHTHKTVKAKGLEATFHFNAPAKAAYTCPMHPEVVSEKPSTCDKCGGMKLVKQSHHIAVQLFDANKKPVQGALVRLTVKDAHGMMQGLNLKGNGYYEGNFALTPGANKLTAFVKQKNATQAVELSVPYEVK